MAGKDETDSSLMDRLPPYSLEAEQGALGCVLAGGDQAAELFADLKETLPSKEAFYDMRHQIIYDTMDQMTNGDDVRQIDAVTLMQCLKDAGNFQKIGELPYLTEIADRVVSVANLPSYAKIINREWRRRAMIRALGDAQAEVMDMEAHADVDQVMDRVEQSVFMVNDRHANNSTVVPIKQAIQEGVDRLENMSRGKGIQSEFPTGLEYMDKVTGGLWPEQLIVFGALPGWGKSSLMMTIARNLMLAGKKVMVCSMEMTPTELALRLMCMDARVNLRENRQGFLSEKSMIKLVSSVGRLSKGQMWIDGEGALDIDRLRAKARRWVARDKIEVIFLDYFQLMQCQRRSHEGQVTELVAVSRGLKTLAKELGVCLVVLAQLNVDFEKRGDKAPGLSDIMYCKALGQDADVFGGLYMNKDRLEKEMQLNNCGGMEDMPYAPVNMRIVKQRNGESGIDVHLRFTKKFTVFEDGHEGKGKWAAADEEAARQDEEETVISEEDVSASSEFFEKKTTGSLIYEEDDEKRRAMNRRVK